MWQARCKQQVICDVQVVGPEKRAEPANEWEAVEVIDEGTAGFPFDPCWILVTMLGSELKHHPGNEGPWLS